MSYVAAGVAVAGVGTSIGGSVLGKGAAKKAKKAKARAVHTANQMLDVGYKESERHLEEGFEESANRLTNYEALGQGALAQLAWGLGFDVPGFEGSNLKKGELLENFSKEHFEKDPGYEFVRDEGIRGVTSSATSRGMLLSGRTLKEMSRWNQKTAENQYENTYRRHQSDKKYNVETLAGITGRGQNAAEFNANLRTNLGKNKANNILAYQDKKAGLQLQMGKVNADAILQRGQYLQNSINSVGNAGANFMQSKSFGSFFS